MPSRRVRTLKHPHSQPNQKIQAHEENHKVDPLVAETNTPLPLVEAQHLLGSHRCGPEKAPERDSLLEPNLELKIEQ